MATGHPFRVIVIPASSGITHYGCAAAQEPSGRSLSPATAASISG